MKVRRILVELNNDYRMVMLGGPAYGYHYEEKVEGIGWVFGVAQDLEYGPDLEILKQVAESVKTRIDALERAIPQTHQVSERDQCHCGSGLYGEAQFDGYGLYLCKTCEHCHQERMSHFRSDIHEQYETCEPINED